MKKQNFSLIELLVVIAIIGILSSLVLPELSEARQKARASVCKNKLKQISTASFIYADDNDNYAPLNDSFASEWWPKKLSQGGIYQKSLLLLTMLILVPINAPWEKNLIAIGPIIILKTIASVSSMMAEPLTQPIPSLVHMVTQRLFTWTPGT
ncbi:type II secretion system protein [Lentisphaera profundi]|uniref:type II secretion system protein n=1 Tax=Lentisphaera profundi TaxID=1658616 RepID=UPI003082421A